MSTSNYDAKIVAEIWGPECVRDGWSPGGVRGGWGHRGVNTDWGHGGMSGVFDVLDFIHPRYYPLPPPAVTAVIFMALALEDNLPFWGWPKKYGIPNIRWFLCWWISN